MFYLAMYIVSVILKATANILRNPAPDERTVDAWVRQQIRVREAIAKAKPKSATQSPAASDDEWVDPWTRQQARLRQAIAQAKEENPTAKSCRTTGR